jgi:Na+-transporting NADH:ubiquinone oxidoreductase subunit NqrD
VKRLIARVLFWTILVAFMLFFVGLLVMLGVAVYQAPHESWSQDAKGLAIFVSIAFTIIGTFSWACENSENK